ncbi:MAG: hypothetical protein NTW50_01685, partial [Candidatus Berkelbacteria bacterium]|nr:hypothetical protein [Candidatus Berkelbacteria bacterium]
MNCGQATDFLGKLRALVAQFDLAAKEERAVRVFDAQKSLNRTRKEFIQNLPEEQCQLFERVEVAREKGYYYVSKFNDKGIGMAERE